MLYETDGRILNLAWAPDGRALAFSLLLSGSSSIHLFDLDTESSRRLTDEGMNDTDPVFSPDGDYVIFTSDRETGHLGLWAVPREGGSPAGISTPSYAVKRIVPLGWSGP